MEKDSRDGFKSNVGTILALAGSAVGLGNIWRFPYVVGENGGAAFILLYLAIIILISIPAFMCELSIGRNTQSNVFGAFKKLSPKTPWYNLGTLSIISCILVASYYTVIAGWTLAFLYKSVINEFSGLEGDQIVNVFSDFVSNPIEPIMWLGLFLGATFVIVMSGVSNGIEKYNKVLMPSLFIIMIIMALNSFSLDNYKAGFEFMFSPDFSKINIDTFINALGQAFFSMSLGMGTIITYGSYARKQDSLFKISIVTAGADLFVAILAGMIIFPAVFSFGISAEAGSGLAFITFPVIFQSMSGGYFFSILFFGLLFIAALTSLISIIEVIVSYFSEEFKLKRKIVTIITCSFIFITASVCSLSLIDGSSLKIQGQSLFELFDHVSASYLLPLTGLLTVIYIGWFKKKDFIKNEISSNGMYSTWYFGVFMILIKYIIPVLMTFILLA